jgi:DNA-binding NarL/FixJ family response regulator
MIRVAMIEDHPIVQAGLSAVIATLSDVELVATVDRVSDLPPSVPRPDVLVLDLHLPGALSGLAAVRHLVEAGHRVLVVTGTDTAMDEVADAVAAGAAGYLTKHAGVEEYGRAIRAVASGRAYLGARLAAHARQASRALAVGDANRLTDRESQVAGLVVDGYTNGEIARLLRVGERTVDGHLENIKAKISETRRVRVAMRLKQLGYRGPAES